MKISKKIVGLVFGAALMFGTGTIVANANDNNTAYNRNNLAYTQLSSQNDNYNKNYNYNENYNDKDSFYRDMYNYCHGNRNENTGYRGGMMNNSYNMMNY